MRPRAARARPGNRRSSTPVDWRIGAVAALLAAGALVALAPAPGRADDLAATAAAEGEDLVQLDFNDAELTTIIDAISKMTGRNFIYDERVRGKVTIKSPTRISREQAYAVFESVLQVKGFTTVETPGGALKIIPLRDARQSNVETAQTYAPPVNTDRYVTRLIPLRYVDAESITNTLKPLISKDGGIEAYQPTNMVIVTEAASNIRRILAILEAVDVESYQDELSVFKIQFADAATLAGQVSEIYGAEVSAAGSTRPTSAATRRTGRSPAVNAAGGSGGPLGRDRVRLITDERTNSVIALAPRTQMQDLRELVKRLDIPVRGGGRIHVYYLQHADAEELALTLSSLVSGSAASPSAAAAQAGQGAPALRAVVEGLAEGVKITADPATNSLVIQSSREGFETLSEVIAKLDVERPQVLVEALIMEVDVTDSEDLGFTGMLRLIDGKTDIATVIAPTAIEGFMLGGPIGAAIGGGAPLIQRILNDTIEKDEDGNPLPGEEGHTIDAIIRASAGDAGTNIISAPHILTMDNEEAEIRIGQNIPIITNRVESAAGITAPTGNLATSVNVERQDIGVTLRVTPQITEGDSLRMEIFQEISAINVGLAASGALGNAADVGVPLSNRQIENVVNIRDGETVVIGGLLSDEYQDTVGKVPFLGDIPILGWAFKTSKRELRKINLLVFLTPHIIRVPPDLELETIRKREEFAEASEEGLEWSERERAAERKRQKAAEAAGEAYEPLGDNPVRISVLDHQARYPEERVGEIRDAEARAREEQEAARLAALHAPEYAVQALVGSDVEKAIDTLQSLIDEGYDGTLVSKDLEGAVYFELQIGPYASFDEAKHVSESVRQVHSLDASVVVVPEEEAEQP